MKKEESHFRYWSLRNKLKELKNYYQLALHFETQNAMGANFL